MKVTYKVNNELGIKYMAKLIFKIYFTPVAQPARLQQSDVDNEVKML